MDHQPIDNRVSQLEAMILRQEELLHHQEAQLSAQRNAAQQAAQQPANQTIELSARDVLEQFRKLKAFQSGQSLVAFLKSVEKTFELCNGNNALANYGASIVVNEKLPQEAVYCVQELDGNPSWTMIKQRLLQQFQPKSTYGEICYRCRNIKVKNCLIFLIKENMI